MVNKSEIKLFNPEKLIGKSISFKPYDAKEPYTFKIISIKEDYGSVCLYNIKEDIDNFDNICPMRIEAIQSLIDKGFYTHVFPPHPEYVLKYKLIVN